ncbi:uncharacterized protein LOC110189517 [Drosophila serrata]|uniref:uncharacterized protein LOC110189517 n=1 Tax=Drosophila serrata TaxID=7274 RepID=UPI000A1D03CA|nr:uncharacterized protein LOC110189517 [Drosophila serrata]
MTKTNKEHQQQGTKCNFSYTTANRIHSQDARQQAKDKDPGRLQSKGRRVNGLRHWAFEQSAPNPLIKEPALPDPVCSPFRGITEELAAGEQVTAIQLHVGETIISSNDK